MISRILLEKIKHQLKDNKVFILQGPKKVGKEQLLIEALGENPNLKIIDGKDKNIRKQLEVVSQDVLIELFEQHPTILIKEAQHLISLQKIIEEILFGDYKITLLLTCSFEPIIDDVLKEALTSHELIMTLYPNLFQEIANTLGLVEFDRTIHQRLIYGNYPGVISDPENAEEYLTTLLQEVISTNLNPNERINKGSKLTKMLQILAFEMGEPISYNDIGFRSGLDNETVERYIDLLQKAFILIRIPTYYNGHKYELKKTHTIYFIDNGIRNAMIRNFNDIDVRNDINELWKNWLISERIKWNSINDNIANYYFWRTHTKQSMDFIEVKGDKIAAYKSIWDKRKKPKFPASFKTAYPSASTHALNRSTYWGFLSKK